MTTNKSHIKIKNQPDGYEKVTEVLDKMEAINICVGKSKRREEETGHNKANHPFLRVVADSAR